MCYETSDINASDDDDLSYVEEKKVEEIEGSEEPKWYFDFEGVSKINNFTKEMQITFKFFYTLVINNIYQNYYAFIVFIVYKSFI